MQGADAALLLIEGSARELMLFAATGLLIGGIDDLAVDLIWLARAAWRRMIGASGRPADLASLPAPTCRGTIAIFIGAWDESTVIGAMLRTALERLDHDDYRIYVGVYPNDPATMAVVGAIAGADRRVTMVGGTLPGPTSKAECLNRLWQRLLADEAAEGRRVKAVVLHDAEDVVHPAELTIFDRLVERHDLVQLPVLPLIDPGSRWIAGSYCDEFAEAHGKQLIVRGALGAAMPLAGTGCAIGRDAMRRLADAGGGAPFDAASLTEDYELGLRVRAAGGSATFIRILGEAGDRMPVAVRAYFPNTLAAAVRQKARWMHGIALSGWDRLGWWGGLAERWMRVRDRRAILAALIVATAYAATALTFIGWGGRMLFGGDPIPAAGGESALIGLTMALLGWRVAMRALLAGREYGWRQGVLAVPRVAISNLIAILAAWRAIFAYLDTRRTGIAQWDKTSHHFPTTLPTP